MFGTANVSNNSTYNVEWQSEVEPTMSDHIHGTFDSHDKTFMYVANLEKLAGKWIHKMLDMMKKIDQLSSQFSYLMA